jgi:hypothetical protein
VCLLLPHHLPLSLPTAGFSLTPEKLTADQQLLQSLLQYHVVPDKALPVDQVRTASPAGGWVAACMLPLQLPPAAYAALPCTVVSKQCHALLSACSGAAPQWTASEVLPTLAPGQTLAVRLPGGRDPNSYLVGAQVGRRE